MSVPITLWWALCTVCDFETDKCQVEAHAERDAEDHIDSTDHSVQQMCSINGVVQR